MDIEDMRELPEDARAALGNYIQAAQVPKLSETCDPVLFVHDSFEAADAPEVEEALADMAASFKHAREAAKPVNFALAGMSLPGPRSEPDALQRALLTPRYPDAPEGSPRARLDALRAQAAEHFRADMEIWEFEIITRDFMDSIPRDTPDRIVFGVEVQTEVGNWRRRGPPVDWQKRVGVLEAELRCLHLANEIAEQSLRTYFWITVGQAAVIVAGVVTVAVLLG